VDQEPAKTSRFSRAKVWFNELSRRTRIIALVIVMLLMLGIIGGIANGKKTADSATSSGRGSVATDISEENLKGIYNGMSGEDFQKIIDKLGRPDLTGRQIPAARYSCKHMAAWKKRDGSYLLLHWLEATDPRNNNKRIETFRTWDNQSMRQVEDLKVFLK
jgi:hypothetical protein